MSWLYLSGLCVLLIVESASLAQESSGEPDDNDTPHLRRHGRATQLIVDGRPFLMLGGELGNSSASTLAYMEPIWRRVVDLNVNTLLVPVYWDLVEPEEGRFDFALVDGLIERARESDLRLVLLWFASWKNSMSCYAPGWVKTDQARFPRAQHPDGSGMEILSPFSDENRDADARAFAALMAHLREVDGDEHTVVMVQVENEIGMIPDARDHSAAADESFSGPVPEALMDYLQQHRDTLIPQFRAQWEEAGSGNAGTWEQVFGPGPFGEEVFMAWHYARYVEQVAAAGKAAYALPMYVNAALIRPNYEPGQYPSAGPLPHLMDVWRAGAPSIDFLAPDIYFPSFSEWCAKYDQSGNPLFIPEAYRDSRNAAAAFYAIGQHNAMGFSPFSIENIAEVEDHPLPVAYDVLRQLSPLILGHQGGETIAGALPVTAFDGTRDTTPQKIDLGDFTLTVSFLLPDIPPEQNQDFHRGPEVDVPIAGGLMIAVAPDEFVIAGKNLIITFEPRTPGDPIAGIEWIQSGHYDDAGRWVVDRWMNGDQSHQGRHMRLPSHTFGIQRIKLYRYR